MRLAHWPIVASLSLVAASQLVVPQQQHPHPFIGTDDTKPNHHQQQQPLVMPPSASPPEVGTVFLSDVMGRDRSINVFAGFTRDFAAVSDRFDNAAQNSTVLAPLNSAIEALPRKPWENAQDYHTLGADAYEGSGGQERAQQNLRRFVEAHIVPVSPWPEKQKAGAMAGDGELWWETTADGKRVIQPGNIEVASVASTVANGQVWIIKGVRNYST